MTHTYKPGDLVKIISMEEVRKWPIYVRNKEYKIGNEVWIPPMDHLAGTIQKIKFVGSGFYDMEDVGYTFSPEMIAGPAEDAKPKSVWSASDVYECLCDLIDLVPTETEDADWWPDDLKKCMQTATTIRDEYDPPESPKEQDTDREKYAERLERFVLAVVVNRDSVSSASAIIESAKNILAAFDEKVKKYK